MIMSTRPPLNSFEGLNKGTSSHTADLIITLIYFLENPLLRGRICEVVLFSKQLYTFSKFTVQSEIPALVPLSLLLLYHVKLKGQLTLLTFYLEFLAISAILLLNYSAYSLPSKYCRKQFYHCFNATRPLSSL